MNAMNYLELLTFVRAVPTEHQFRLEEIFRAGIELREARLHGNVEQVETAQKRTATAVWLLLYDFAKDEGEGKAIDRLEAQYVFTGLMTASDVLDLTEGELEELKKRIRP